MIEVLFDILIDMAGIDVKEIWVWPDSPSISLDEVIIEKERGLLENEEPYGDTWKHPVKVERNKEYHISRIIYFMNHPEEISGIEVDTYYQFLIKKLERGL